MLEKAGSKRLLCRPIDLGQRYQTPRFHIHLAVMANYFIGQIIQVQQDHRNTPSIGLVSRIFSEAAGTYVEAFVIFVASTKEASDRSAIPWLYSVGV